MIFPGVLSFFKVFRSSGNPEAVRLAIPSQNQEPQTQYFSSIGESHTRGGTWKMDSSKHASRILHLCQKEDLSITYIQN